MPYEFNWCIPSRVICQRIYGRHSLPEIRQANGQALEFISEGVPPVHIIADILDMTSFPTPISTLLDSATVLLHVNFGWLVVVSRPNMVITAALAVFRRTLPMNVTIVASLEEAIAFLYEQDETLGPAQE
jgi:hypothetical protein